MYRLWSLDWFKKPSEEMKKLLDAIDKARRGNYGKAGPALASTVSEVPRIQDGVDPLAAAVGEIQPVPDRPERPAEPAPSRTEIFAGILKTGLKVGTAVLSADKGKGLDAAIDALTKDEKKKK
jgi:hypothetical protein